MYYIVSLLFLRKLFLSLLLYGRRPEYRSWRLGLGFSPDFTTKFLSVLVISLSSVDPAFLNFLTNIIVLMSL